MHVHTYAPSEIILPRGVHADCLGLVVRGQVAVHVTRYGIARPLVLLLPGSSFGEAMLTEGRPSTATLQALTRCEVWFLRRADLKALVGKRQSQRRVDLLRRFVALSAVALAAWLVMALLLLVPATRQAMAVVPMGIGQLCREGGYGLCAERAWTVAATLVPTDANPLLVLGVLHFEQGEVAAAEQYFEAANTLAPDSPEVLNNLGLVYAHQGDQAKAISAFRQAIDLEPGTAAVENNLGRSLQAIHAYDEALVHYQLALSLGEPQASILANMAVAYYESAQPLEAADAARQALRYDETSVAAYTVLGAVALESRQPEEALAYLRRAIALDAAYHQADFYLGLAYKSLDQPAKAIVAFEQALANADDEVTRVRIRRYLNELYEAERQDGSP
jgi:tetratricopeptide (TPR) repeat protein